MSITFLQKRKIAYFVSGSLLTLSIFSLSTNGLNQGVDFVGGRTYTVRFDKDVNQSEIQASLIDVLGNAEAKTFGSDNQLKITTNYKVDVEGTQVDEEIQTKMFESLKNVLPENLSYDEFVNGSEDKAIGIMGSSKVGPTIAMILKRTHSWPSLVLYLLFLYIFYSDLEIGNILWVQLQLFFMMF